MAFCVRCGQQLDEGMNYCPVCGTAVTAADTAAETTIPIVDTTPAYDPATASDYRVILFSRGSCSAANARALLRDILGYSASEARNILNIAPVEIACNMTMAQAMYLAQALTEYGIEVTVCNSQGYVNVPQAATTSVYDRTGSFLPAVASALAALSAVNRVREFRRWNAVTSPSLFRLAFRPAPPPRSARRYSSFGIFHPAPRPTPRPVSPRPVAPSVPQGMFGGRPSGTPNRPSQKNTGGISGGMPNRPSGGTSFGGRPGGSIKPGGNSAFGGRPGSGGSRPSGGKPGGAGRPGGRGNQRF